MSNTDAEILAGLDRALEAGTMVLFDPAAPAVPTVTVTRVRFLEDDVYDGSIPHECYENALTETYECDDDETIVEDAVRVLNREGVTFGATGADWAANPDGSVIVDYATGEREEVSAHLTGFPVGALATIVGAVG